MQVTAYLLHSRRYRDSSLIVDLFCRELGRVSCVARGALRPKSSLPVRHPFQALSVAFQGRGELPTLVRAEALQVPIALSGQRLYCGFYLNELLLKLTVRHDAHPSLFDVYAESLNSLADNSPLEPVLRRFEVRLLEELGLGLTLDHDHEGQPLYADQMYTYSIDAGPAPVTGVHTDALRGDTLLGLRSGEFANDAALREARTLMRKVIDYHLDGKPLHSRTLFR